MPRTVTAVILTLALIGCGLLFWASWRAGGSGEE